MGSSNILLEAEDARILEEASPLSPLTSVLNFFWIAYQNFFNNPANQPANLVHHYNKIIQEKVPKKKK